MIAEVTCGKCGTIYQTYVEPANYDSTEIGDEIILSCENGCGDCVHTIEDVLA